MASGRGRVGGVAAKEVAVVKTVVVMKAEAWMESVALVGTETVALVETETVEWESMAVVEALAVGVVAVLKTVAVVNALPDVDTEAMGTVTVV